MGLLIVVVLLVLVLSACCSGSEAALFSVSPLKAKKLAQSGNKPAVALQKIREDMGRPITAIVIINNVVNIGGSIFVGKIAGEVLGNDWLGIFSAVLTFLVIVFSEIIPKTLGENYCEKVSLVIARPVLALSRLMTPFVWGIEKITQPFTRNNRKYTTNEAEIRLLASIGRKEGVIEDDESEMIQRIFDLNDYTAKDIMTPRVAMTSIWGEAVLADVQQQIIDSQHSRLVVIGETPDKVLGVAYKSELLSTIVLGKQDERVVQHSSEAHFVQENTRADKLLPMFQSTHRHIAVVVGEYGGVSGVITLEDVLEVITGEIVDETDRVVDMQEFARQRNHSYS